MPRPTKSTTTRFNRWSWSNLIRRATSVNKPQLELRSLEDRAVPAVFTVTNTFDTGPNSLRAAITNAKNNPGADTIQFLNVTGTIALTTGELAIADGLDIVGPGVDKLTINGGGAVRLFSTTGSATGAAINISGLTLTNGKAAGGGAILIGDEAVSLTNCVITGNSSTLDGGGIYVTAAAGSLTVQNCTISNNTTTGSGIDGGGIAFQLAGSLVMNNSTVSGNTAADSGGGIYFRQGGKFSITNSTISGNVGGSASTSIGGGVYFFGLATGPLTIQQSTVSSNTIGGAGGGIVLANFTGGLALQNSTVAFNASTAVGTVGGGIARTGGSGSLTLDSTIVAKNTSQSGTGPDLSFTSLTTIAGTGNLIGVNDSGNAGVSAFGNLFGTKAGPLDPQLGGLANNSGTTKTHRPVSGSPAIDKGANPAALSFDQRGVTRVLGAAADVGAVEVAVPLVVNNTNDSGPGSLRRAIEDANLDVGIFNVVSFDPIFFNVPRTIALTGGELAITDGGAVTGPGNVTIDAGSSSRHFNINGFGTINVALTGMTLINGRVASGTGGSIFVHDDTVILSKMTIANNTAATGRGGAIAISQSAAAVTIADSIISGNAAPTSDGGGISVYGAAALTVQRSRITGNTAGVDGGGIYFFGGGSLTLADSTVDGNTANASAADQGGGGIYFFGPVGAGGFNVVNSTISNNKTLNGNGGGLQLRYMGGTATIRNTTITGNSAMFGLGGGIARAYGNGSTNLDSTIVAGNVGGAAPNISCDGTVVAAFSALGDNKGMAAFAADATTVGLLGANFKLGSLANNGGAHPTHLPAIDSPLVNKGTNLAALANDQRGAGYGRTRSGSADIGAVEAKSNFVVLNANASSTGSLDQAVFDADSFIGADTIKFDPVFFATPRTIPVVFGELALTEAVAIVGPGAGKATVSGESTSRVFNTEAAPAGAAIGITGLTIANGKTSDFGAGISGFDEALTLTDCVVTGNSTTLSGGGIHLFNGSLSLIGCTVSNNSTGFGHFGGGVGVNSGTVVIENSKITGNNSGIGGGLGLTNGTLLLQNSTVDGNVANNGSGGGIYMLGTIVATIRGSTISGNMTAAGGAYGGGIHIQNGSLLLQNTTVASNISALSGGGISIHDSAVFKAQNSTIVYNKSNSVNGGGGGLYVQAGAATLDSTIVAKNVSAKSPDIIVGLITTTNCFIGNTSGATYTGNPLTGDPLLGTLQNNGGPTLTIRPASNSPVLDKGANPAGLLSDQRGVTRTLGKAADIGAYEVASPLVVFNDNEAGTGSLRQAISDANVDPGTNTITFDPTYFSTTRNIALTSSSLYVTEAVTIAGPGAAKANVSGTGILTPFVIDAAGVGNVVSISGLTVSNGHSVGGSGGGIVNYDEALTLSDCVVTGNFADSTGGGIYLGTSKAALTLVRSTVSNNSANGHGGGVSNDGGAPIAAYDSTISGNFAYFAGGGINMYNGGSLLLSGCTISSNTTKSNGGGLYFHGSAGAGGLVVRNTTISGNTASGDGGGIVLQALTGTLTVQNSTITANVTTGGKGGGIANQLNSGLIALESSIVAGNSTNVAGPDVSAPGTVNATTTLLGSLAGIGTFNPDAVTTSLLGKAAQLGPLSNNGGPTKTHALLPGSPAINNGSNPSLQTSDQRGGGFVRVYGGSPDIGAFEVQPTSKITSIVINGGAAQRSRVTTIDVTFDSPVTLGGGAFTLVRQSDGAAVTLNTNVLGNTATITFVGGAVNAGSLADGRYTLTAVADQLNGGNFDGNDDGTAGDNYQLVGNTSNKLFRLFGDADGDGDVDNSDFVAFRTALGNGPSFFDADGDGDTDNADFVAFRVRFGTMV